MAFSKDLDALARRKTAELALRFANEARTTVPPFPRTGDLASSVKPGPVSGSAGVYSSTVTVGEEYGVYQETGTGPIVPRRPGGVLRFTTRRGTVVFTRRTRGVPKTRWWSRAKTQWPRIVSESNR